jgi:hypothetical protein
MLRIDLNKVANKYSSYFERKKRCCEIPMSPEAWLWHNLDLLNIEELLKR